MLIKIFLNYLFGYVNITIEGFFIERLMNIAASKKIFLWNVQRKRSSMMNANISIKDFKKMKGITKKTKCRIKINQKKGLPFLIQKYQRRKIFFILLIPMIMALVISSRYLWNIEVIGAEKIKKEELIQELKILGLETGKLKNKINTKDIITNLRLQRNDISWMEINLKGTNAIVSIVEAKEKPEIIKEEPCNIVSNVRGRVVKITANKGTPLVKVGDIIEKGTILIGGYMEEKYTDTRYVHAQGEVQANVWYTKRKQSNYTREVSTFTGNEKNRYKISMHNFTINLYKSIPKFEKYDTISADKKIRLFTNFYLPITITKNTYQEIKTEPITYGKQELQTILINELEEEFRKEKIEDKKVMNKIVNVYQTEDKKLEIEMTYEVLETIGTEEKLNR